MLFSSLLEAFFGYLLSQNLMVYLGIALPGHSVAANLCILFNLFMMSVFLWLLLQAYYIFFAPLDLYKDLGSVGYVRHDLRVSKEQNIINTMKRKKIGKSPPVYPNGWFRIMDSSSLEKGRVKSVYVFGHQFAVFRNHRGIVRIVDAYCPHLGANMAAGGKVVGADCLECPFHGWKFDGETGKLVDIPYSKKVPSFVSIPTWPCCEENGVIFLWYHCDKLEPNWRMPVAKTRSQLKYVGRTEHIINAHIQDIPENAADLAHLDHLHKPVIGSDVEMTNNSFLNNMVKHGIKAVWKASDNPEERHCSVMDIQDDIYLHIFNRKLPLIRLKFHIDQIGPGAVHIYVETPFFYGLMVQNVTPVEPFQQSLAHSFYISPWVPTFIGKAFYLLETTQIERDILMWNNKTYLHQPVLVKEEAILGKHRRWYQQFYSKNSPTCEEVEKRSTNELNDW